MIFAFVDMLSLGLSITPVDSVLHGILYNEFLELLPLEFQVA